MYVNSNEFLEIHNKNFNNFETQVLKFYFILWTNCMPDTQLIWFLLVWVGTRAFLLYMATNSTVSYRPVTQPDPAEFVGPVTCGPWPGSDSVIRYGLCYRCRLTSTRLSLRRTHKTSEIKGKPDCGQLLFFLHDGRQNLCSFDPGYREQTPMLTGKRWQRRTCNISCRCRC